MYRTFGKAAVFIGILGVLVSGTKSIAAPLYVDLRTVPSGPVRYYCEFVVLRAKSLEAPGHDTVIFVKKNDVSKATASSIYGYYGGGTDIPSVLATTFFGSVIPELALNGYMASKWDDYQHNSDDSIAIIWEIDERRYDAALAVTQHWIQNPSVYQLDARDCTNYVEDIAVTLGLRNPSRTFLNGIPPAYINSIKESIQTNLHQTFPDGSTFTGTRVANVPEGICAVTEPNGSRYVGGFYGGVMSGAGVWSDSKGNRYSGMFADGTPYGQGLATFADGIQIKGHFCDTSVSSATVTYPNHSKFIGALESGIAEGPGVYSSGNGKSAVAVFQNGRAIIDGQQVCLPTTTAADLYNLSQLKFP